MTNNNLKIILIGASGSGKSTLRKMYCDSYPNTRLLLAVTTRSPREGEINGVDKFFIDNKEFIIHQNQGDLCFVNNVYGDLYGFYKRDFTYDGLIIGEMYYKHYEEITKNVQNVVSVYIRSESKDILKKSLMKRRSSESEITRRLASLDDEYFELERLRSCNKFDYEFTNMFNEKSKQEFVRLINSIIINTGLGE